MSLTRDDVFWNGFSEHAQRSIKASALLLELVEQPKDKRAVARDITTLEAEGDSITHEVMAALHKTWITPLDREDIHALIKTLDDFLDAIEESSERIVIYDIVKRNEAAVSMAKVVQKMADGVSRAVNAVRDLKNPEEILRICVDLNHLEGDADHTLRTALAELFRTESNAIEVIKWQKLLDSLERATDAAEEVAHVLEGVVLEHA